MACHGHARLLAEVYQESLWRGGLCGRASRPVLARSGWPGWPAWRREDCGEGRQNDASMQQYTEPVARCQALARPAPAMDKVSAPHDAKLFFRGIEAPARQHRTNFQRAIAIRVFEPRPGSRSARRRVPAALEGKAQLLSSLAIRGPQGGPGGLHYPSSGPGGPVRRRSGRCIDVRDQAHTPRRASRDSAAA